MALGSVSGQGGGQGGAGTQFGVGSVLALLGLVILSGVLYFAHPVTVQGDLSCHNLTVTTNANIGGILTVTKPAYDDIRCLGFKRTTGASDMTVGEYISGSGVYDHVAASGNSIYFTVQLPHSWKKGTNLDPHVHWSSNADTSDYDGKTVIWTLTYTLASPNGTFPAVNSDRTATYTYPVTTSSYQYKHMYTDLGDIDMSAYTAATDTSVIFIGRLTRTGNASNTTIFLHEFDMHFQRDALGSDNETTKTF